MIWSNCLSPAVSFSGSYVGSVPACLANVSPSSMLFNSISFSSKASSFATWINIASLVISPAQSSLLKTVPSTPAWSVNHVDAHSLIPALLNASLIKSGNATRMTTELLSFSSISRTTVQFKSLILSAMLPSSKPLS
ncbi:MAG: hypothetical protein BWY95_01078 [Bacteroidetes bacterium ADurb.BinA104]|nr:MAG: hypothetical protein BWY95_01078 [Bacteroidetes bacterium ADurb.BinA104]